MVKISIIFNFALSWLVNCQEHPPCISKDSQQGSCIDLSSFMSNCLMIGIGMDPGNCTAGNICCPQAQIFSSNQSPISITTNNPLLSSLSQLSNPNFQFPPNNPIPNSFIQSPSGNMPNPFNQFIPNNMNPANQIPFNIFNPSSSKPNNPSSIPISFIQPNTQISNPFSPFFPTNNFNPLNNPFGSIYPPNNINPFSNNPYSNNPFSINSYSNNPFSMNNLNSNGFPFSPNNNVNSFSMNSNGQVCANTRNNNTPSFSSRILGGNPINQNNICWQVVILDEGTNNFLGSGSLIKPQWVLTAASVVKRVKSGRLRVILGDVSTNCVQHVLVSSVIVHQQYNLPSFKSENNIALLQLSTPAETAKNCICTICLPSPDTDFSGQIAVVSGYGATTEEGKYPNFPLTKTQVPILNNQMCQSMFQSLGISLDLNSQICAGGRGQDSCKGDGGGPLFFIDTTGTPYLVGIVSTGIGCGRQGVPAIYTSVPKNYDYIVNTAV